MLIASSKNKYESSAAETSVLLSELFDLTAESIIFSIGFRKPSALRAERWCKAGRRRLVVSTSLESAAAEAFQKKIKLLTERVLQIMLLY